MILSGAEQVHSSDSNRRFFVKHGSYADAVRDFYSVRPTDITEWKAMDLKNVWVCVFIVHHSFWNLLL